MVYKLKTAIGKAIYGLRKCMVEPEIGIIKEVLGFRQFSLHGERAVAGEWFLVQQHTLSGAARSACFAYPSTRSGETQKGDGQSERA